MSLTGHGVPQQFPRKGEGYWPQTTARINGLCVRVVVGSAPDFGRFPHGSRYCARLLSQRARQTDRSRGRRHRNSAEDKLGLMRQAPDDTHTRTASRKPTVRRSRTKHRGVSRRRPKILDGRQSTLSLSRFSADMS